MKIVNLFATGYLIFNCRNGISGWSLKLTNSFEVPIPTRDQRTKNEGPPPKNVRVCFTDSNKDPGDCPGRIPME